MTYANYFVKTFTFGAKTFTFLATRWAHLTRRRPYKLQVLPLATLPHYTPAALRVTVLQFCREGVKRGKEGYYLYIIYIYIIYIIVNIFTYIFCYFSSLSADDGLIKKL